MHVNHLPESTLVKLRRNKNILDVIRYDNKTYAITNRKLKHGVADGIDHISIAEFFNPNSTQADIIEGGYSLINNKPLSEILGLKSEIIITYNLQNLSSLEKSKFSHALLGRGKNNTGIVGELGGKILGKGCISVPEKSSEKISDIMKKWKIQFSSDKVLK